MLISTKAVVKWNSKNKAHYVNLGYEFTGIGECFEVNTDELTAGSRASVDIICDYCGKKFSQQWCTYVRLKKNGVVCSDCCGDPKCTGEKAKDALINKYGVSNAAFIDGVKEKREKTNIKRYGVDNVFKSEEIKKKIKDSNMRKFGAPHHMMTQAVKDKVSGTCMKKYGVACYLNLNYGEGMFTREKNWNWNPNKSDEQREAERRMPEYRVWRKMVLDRDGYRCMKCGSYGDSHVAISKSKGLNVHHILPYKTNPDERYSVDNGITLCRSCHLKFHSLYGKDSNSGDKIKEFLSDGEKIC